MTLFFEKYESPFFKRIKERCNVTHYIELFHEQFNRANYNNKTLADCKLRFNDKILPYGGFPDFKKEHQAEFSTWDDMEFDRVWGTNPCSEIKLPTSNRAAAWNGVTA